MDVDAGDAFVERIRPLARHTVRPEVLSGVGGFGGLFALPQDRWKEPVLVSGTDGVGTKLKVAFEAGLHHTIGIDLVAMSVNDVLTTGAEPLFFLDYFATSRLDVEQGAKVVEGIAQGCTLAGCTLIGGETAELPGFYKEGEYDLAGFCVGVVERSKILTGDDIRPGDALVGIASSGLHSNGYSLARKVLLEEQGLSLSAGVPGLKRSLGDELLAPTRIYVREILDLLPMVDVKAMAHITGGGIPGNLPRVLPRGTCAVVDRKEWEKPAIFDVIARLGKVDEEEMFRVFNMGLGMILVMASPEVPPAIRRLKKAKLRAWEIGRIEAAEGEPFVRWAADGR